MGFLSVINRVGLTMLLLCDNGGIDSSHYIMYIEFAPGIG